MSDQHFKLSLHEIEEVMLEVLDSGGEFSLIVNGTSMKPLLKGGRDGVALVKEGPKIKDVVLYKRANGAFILHRIIGKNSEGFIMCGDNQFVKEYGIREENIIARVAYVVKKGKKIPSSSFKYRTYVSFLPLLRLYKKTRYKIGRIIHGKRRQINN